MLLHIYWALHLGAANLIRPVHDVCGSWYSLLVILEPIITILWLIVSPPFTHSPSPLDGHFMAVHHIQFVSSGTRYSLLLFLYILFKLHPISWTTVCSFHLLLVSMPSNAFLSIQFWTSSYFINCCTLISSLLNIVLFIIVAHLIHCMIMSLFSYLL